MEGNKFNISLLIKYIHMSIMINIEVYLQHTIYCG